MAIDSITAKILFLDELAQTVGAWKADGEKVVQCHGVFDLLHPGHIKHFEAARKEGDRLIVTLTPDRFVNKGPGRPIFNEELRAHTLASMEVIDAVAVNEWPTAVETLRKLEPDVYVKGSDYGDPDEDVTGNITEEREAVEAGGGRLHITREITFSSSNLINTHLSSYPQETEDYLTAFRGKYSEDEIFSALSQIENLRVLVIGEAIIDEYVLCEGLGKSSKDPILAFHDRGTERYAGGTVAVSNHMSSFCENSAKKTYLEESLAKNVSPLLLQREGAPTITKRRFIDTHTKAKLIEIYEMAETAIPPDVQSRLLTALETAIPDHDLVVVVDYGHGMMTPEIIAKVCGLAPFVSVNTQHNAGNRGFNTISRYPRADYVCMNGHELAIECRLRHVPPGEQLALLKESVNCDRYTVTLGSEGSLHFSEKGETLQAPALALRVVDRVGAGDAVLALTSPLVCAGVPWEIVAFLTNVAGAELVGNLGTGMKLDRGGLQNHIRSLLK